MRPFGTEAEDKMFIIASGAELDCIMKVMTVVGPTGGAHFPTEPQHVRRHMASHNLNHVFLLFGGGAFGMTEVMTKIGPK
jgi:hypothetical protein